MLYSRRRGLNVLSPPELVQATPSRSCTLQSFHLQEETDEIYQQEKRRYVRHCHSLNAGFSHHTPVFLICCLSWALSDKYISIPHTHTYICLIPTPHIPTIFSMKKRCSISSWLSGQFVSFRVQAGNKTLLLDGFSLARPVSTSSDQRGTWGEVIYETVSQLVMRDTIYQ